MKVKIKEIMMKTNIQDVIMTAIIIAYTFFMEVINKDVITIIIWLIIQSLILIFIFNKYWDKKIFICLLISILLLGIYILVNPVYIKSITYCALIYFNMIISAMLWKAYFNSDTKRKLKRSLSIFAICGVILSLMVIVESIIQKNIFFGVISRYNPLGIVGKSSYVCFGSMGNHIVLTMYLWFLFIISYYLFSDTNKKMYIIFSIINVISIFMSGSRTGYVFAIAIVTVILIDYFLIFIKQKESRNITKKKVLGIIFIILVALIILAILFNSVFKDIISRFRLLFYGKEKSSLTHRVSAIIVTVEWFLKLNPIQWFSGSGYGMLTAFLENNSLSATEMSNFYIVDNQWASILYNNGIIVFGLIAMIVLKNIFKEGIFNVETRKYSMLCQGLFLMISIYMFSFDTFTWMSSTSIIGFCYAISLLNEESNNKSIEDSSKVKIDITNT